MLVFILSNHEHFFSPQRKLRIYGRLVKAYNLSRRVSSCYTATIREHKYFISNFQVGLQRGLQGRV